MLKSSKTKTILFSLLGSIFALTALLIFILLPTSDLANGIEHSGKDALFVLVFAPVLSLLGSASTIYAFIKDSKIWEKILTKSIVTGITGLSLAFGILNLGTYLSYTVMQFSLGFVAPYGNTVFEILSVANIVTVVLHFMFTALITIAVKKDK